MAVTVRDRVAKIGPGRQDAGIYRIEADERDAIRETTKDTTTSKTANPKMVFVTFVTFVFFVVNAFI